MSKPFPKLTNINPNHELHLKWKSLIYRCYNESQLVRRPNYRDVSVCEEWWNFDNFTKWYQSQSREVHIDKDLKVLGSKLYSSDTCLLVSPEVNGFLIGLFLPREQYMRGVCYKSKCNTRPWVAQMNYNKRMRHIGVYATELEAHGHWQLYKATKAFELAGQQNNPEVGKALCDLGIRLLEDRDEFKESMFN